MTPLERAAFAAAMAHHKVDTMDHETAMRFMPIVRAVLTAIREPSEAMEEGGADAGDWNRDNLSIGREAKKVYQAMIDAMLEEG